MFKPIESTPEEMASMEEVLTKAWEFQKGRAQEAADGLDSPAARWRRKYLTLHSETIYPLDLQFVGEQIGVKSLSLADLDEIGTIVSLSGYSLYEIESAEAHAAFSEALLFVGVWSLETPFRRFFGEVIEAREFYRTEGPVAQDIQIIRNALLAINPFPELKKVQSGAGL